MAVDGAHVYWAGTGIDRANLDGTNVDRTSSQRDQAPAASRSTDFHRPHRHHNRLQRVQFRELKKNKRKGTAKLTVKVPGPGELELARTNKVKAEEQTAEDAGEQKLIVRSKGEAKKKLNSDGKAKVNPKVTFTPDGGEPNTERKQITLVKR